MFSNHVLLLIRRKFYRDKEFIPVFKLVQTALAMCYFNGLPVTLTDYIFNVNFLQLVDDEIKTIRKVRMSLEV